MSIPAFFLIGYKYKRKLISSFNYGQIDDISKLLPTANSEITANLPANRTITGDLNLKIYRINGQKTEERE